MPAPQWNFAGIPDAPTTPASAAKTGLNFEGIPDAKKPVDPILKAAAIAQLARTDLPDDVRKELEAIENGTHSAAKGNVLSDVLGGVRSGVATSAVGITDVVRRGLGKTPIADTPAAQALMTAPDSLAGSVGRVGEQVGEFMLPASAIAKAVKASPIALQFLKVGMSPRVAALMASATEGLAQGGTAAGVAKIQGSDPTGAAVAGGLSAVAPVAAKAIELRAPAIRAAAQAKLARLLATGLEDKGGQASLVDYALKTGTDAADVVRSSVGKATEIVRNAASELLDLPVNASWGKWQTMLASRTESAKRLLGTALKGSFGDQRVPTAPLIDAFTQMSDTATQHLAQVKGGMKHVVFDVPLNKELEALRDTIGKYGDPNSGFGPMISVRNLVDLKRVWDKTVYTLATAGKVNADASTLVSNAMKEAAFTGANAIRQVLDDAAPTIAKLDEVVSHAIRLEDLVRKVAASHPGMTDAAKVTLHGIGIGAGGVAGQTVLGHWWLGSTMGAAVAKLVTQAVESPLWHTASPAMKNALAGALQRGDAQAIRQVVTPIIAKTATAGTPPNRPSTEALPADLPQ